MNKPRLWIAFVASAFAIAMLCSPLAAQPNYLYGLNRGIDYTPGHPIRLTYNADSAAGPLHVSFYALTVDQAIAMYRRNPWRVDPGDVSGRLVREFDSTDRLDSSNAASDGRIVDLGMPSIGFYAVVVRSAHGVVAQLIDVTTLGLVLNGTGSRHSVWCVDLRTFQHHDGPTHIWSADQTAGADRFADASGLAIFNADLPAGSVFVARTADGSTSIQPLDENDWSPRSDATGKRMRGYIQTDRPVYRPGQHVFFRAIMREGYVGSYTVPHGDRRVRIEDGSHRLIYDERLPVDTFGTIHGDADLPDDARLGGYTLEVDGGLAMGFSVQAYKKPEYEIALAPTAEWFLAGTPAHFTFNAKYFFGRPVVGMHVRYTSAVDSRGVWQWGQGPPGFESPTPEPNRSAPPIDIVTDKDGNVAIDIPTEHEPIFRQSLSLDVEGRDESGRTVSTTSSAVIEPALFSLSVSPQWGGGKPGDPIPVVVDTVDNVTGATDGAFAGTAIDVHIFATKSNDPFHKQGPFFTTKRSLQIDADGSCTFTFTPPGVGHYVLAVSAKDRLGNPIWAEGSFDVSQPMHSQLTTPSPDPGPSIGLDKGLYREGDRPQVTVSLAEPNRDVLVSTYYDGLFNAQVLHIASTSAKTDISVPRGARDINVTAELPTETGVNQHSTGAGIDWTKGLTVVLKPDKDRYLPGQKARFDVLVTGTNGRPVRAEVALGVVDQALYDVVSGNFANPSDSFYPNYNYWQEGEQPRYSWFLPNNVNTIARVVARSRTGAFQANQTMDAFTVNGVSMSRIALRSNLLDTAFWSATVVTDAQGRAHVAFPWPDNLTTWVAFATAVTTDTRLGSAQANALVTKDFLVRLEMPRFLRKNDRSQIGAIVHGKADAPRVSLQLGQGRLSPALFDATLTLDDAQSASTSWPISAGRDLGDVALTLRGTDGKRTDGLQFTLPIEADGPAEHMRDAGSLPEENSTQLSIPPGYDAGTLRINFAPSELARLIDGIRLLDVYPYYCTEQTMSAALPAVFVQHALSQTGVQEPDRLKTSAIVGKAIIRLVQLQHADGSWGWWEHDATHPFMTAYAVYGLAEFRKAGYTVPSSVYDRGVDSLVAQMHTSGDTLRLWGGAQSGSEWNTRAYMLFALAQAAPQRVDRQLLRATADRAANLNPYALAVLGLAYHELGDDASARLLLQQLNARATGDGDRTYWQGPTWHYAWEDDPIETTAYALRLNTALDPGAPIVRHVVAFLLTEQRGSWWYTTKDTAAAIDAISESIDPSAHEFNPDETVRVRVGNRVVREIHITRPVMNAADTSVVVPAAGLRDGTTVSFERSGTGSLYWSTDFERYAPTNSIQSRDSATPLFARLFPKVPDLSVDRRYSVKHGGPWQVGDEVAVDVTVSARTAMQYIAVEDPFPAGVEYQPDQGTADWNWSGVQFFDDRAVFFATEITPERPLHLHYTLRVTTPGVYTAPSPIAYAMYGPPIRAVGAPQRVEVVEP